MVGQRFRPGGSAARISDAKQRPGGWPGRCEKVAQDAPGGSRFCGGNCGGTAVGFSSPSEEDAQSVGTIRSIVRTKCGGIG